MFGSSLCQKLRTKITNVAVCQFNQIRWKRNKLRIKDPKDAKEKQGARIRRVLKKTTTSTTETTGPKYEGLTQIDGSDRDPVHDVYIQAWHKTPVYPLNEIITMHSETLQPAMLNSMDSVLYAEMELNLKTKKKTKFSPTIRSAIVFPHDFEYARPKKIAVFCESREEEELATRLGAQYVGGKKLVEDVFNKHITDLGVDIVLTTPDFYPQLLKIKPVLGKYMPSQKTGILTVDANIEEMMTVAKNSVIFESHKTDDPAVATLQAPFARLNMSYEQIFANLRAFCDLVASLKSGSISSYINSLSILAPPSTEKFLLDLKTDEFKDKKSEPKSKNKKKKIVEEEDVDEEEEEEEKVESL